MNIDKWKNLFVKWIASYRSWEWKYYNFHTLLCQFTNRFHWHYELHVFKGGSETEVTIYFPIHYFSSTNL